MQILYLFLFWQKNCLLPFVLQNIWAAFYLTKYMGYRPDCLLALGYRWVMPWCSSDVQDVLMFHWCTGFPDVPVMSAFAEISLYLFCRDLPAFCWQYFVWLLSDLFGCDEFSNWIVLASALWWSASMKARPKLCALLSFSTGVPQSYQITVFLAPSVSGCRKFDVIKGIFVHVAK